MAATYTNTLPTHKDWVRFLIGDTNIASAQLQDEEIAALINEQLNQHTDGDWIHYLAAAVALDGLRAKWTAMGAGIVSKQVSRLSITLGAAGGSADDALKNRIKELRERGAWLLLPRPRAFANL